MYASQELQQEDRKFWYNCMSPAPWQAQALLTWNRKTKLSTDARHFQIRNWLGKLWREEDLQLGCWWVLAKDNPAFLAKRRREERERNAKAHKWRETPSEVIIPFNAPPPGSVQRIPSRPDPTHEELQAKEMESDSVVPWHAHVLMLGWNRHGKTIMEINREYWEDKFFAHGIKKANFSLMKDCGDRDIVGYVADHIYGWHSLHAEFDTLHERIIERAIRANA